MRFVRVFIVVGLISFLTACGPGGGPSSGLVKKAIALQLTQVQQELSQQLSASSIQASSVNIDRVNITEQEALPIEDLEGYRVRGTYNLTLKTKHRRVTQRQNPFEVYLQRQAEGKTWRLARPQPLADEPGDRWATQLIPNG